VGAQFGDQLVHSRSVTDVTVVKVEIFARNVLVVVKMINPRTVECAGAADEPVDLIALFQELLGHI
jgi:hypothetical protein